MSTHARLTAASAAAVLGLLLTGCDNPETEQAPEAPAETTAPMEEGATSAPTTAATGMADDATAGTGAEGTVPEGDTGGAGAGGAGGGASPGTGN
ncbi:hypothetical protein [Kocuria arenosa]|uniref:hypothetical protein n=1 Tax=Kocuria arenosa TaxID=3071446 RepID=UPI0034D3AB6F